MKQVAMWERWRDNKFLCLITFAEKKNSFFRLFSMPETLQEDFQNNQVQ